MEKKYYPRCNVNRYRKYLSPCGQNVLDVLVKQWNINIDAENNRLKYQCRQAPVPSKKIMTFEDPNVSKILTPVDETEIVNRQLNIHEKKNDITVPTSVELVKTVDRYNSTEIDHFIRDDLIQTVERDKHEDSPECRHGKDKYVETELNICTDAVESNNNNIKIVKWTDMVDTGLFTDEITSSQNEDQEYGGNIKVIVNSIDAEDLNGNAKEKDYKSSRVESFDEANSVTEINDEDNKKLQKRRKRSKIIESAPEKVKKITSTAKVQAKNSFRKQKYTKTVKNWLNEVNPDNPVEDETENACVNTKSEMTIGGTSKGKFNKKIIQAQLANKDGVMKFRKPDDRNLTNENVQREITDGKKCKTKFVAPIKSQTPVMDVTYEICTIDASTGTNKLIELDNIENKVILVLFYRNGFCQLNRHHTDDTCVAEGIMVHVNGCFYYLKGNIDVKLGETILQKLQNNDIICYEGKEIFIYLMSYFGLDLHKFNINDVKIGGGLLDPDNPPQNFSELQKLLAFTPEHTIATECPLQKCVWYITLLDQCASKLRSLLMENSLWNVFVNIEMRLLPIITEMERRGVKVDMEKLTAMENLLLGKMKSVEQECYEAAGKVFQINSAVQVGNILYDELKLDTKCNVKIRETIGKGAKSTSESMLRGLVSVHPLPGLILQYRQLHKAHATFLTGVAQHVRDGVVRPTWVQIAAVTGRIASNNPNLQAIPKTSFSLDTFHEDGNNECRVKFRSVYTRRAGRALLAADFRHVECRVVAQAAGAAPLLAALAHSDDLFKALAAKWLNKTEDTVTCEERERTKRVVYASLYGAGSRRLGDILQLSHDHTLAIMSSFNRTFPSLKSFGRTVVSQCEANGGRLRTICGRVRHFRHIGSGDFALRSHAERQAVNFVVQGSAADLCKVAMVLTEQRLREQSPPIECHLLLQIHDELVWEVRNEDMERAARIIKDVMENCGYECGMAMALPVAMSRGPNWGEMVEFTPAGEQ